jgi:hypothetical protein
MMTFNTFDGPVRTLTFSTPGPEGKRGGGTLTLAGSGDAPWPTLMMSGMIPERQNVVIVVAVAGTSGGGIPAVVLQAPDGEQLRILVDSANQRWGYILASTTSDPRQLIWGPIPGEVGPADLIEFTITRQIGRISVDGALGSGQIFMPDEPYRRELTVHLGAYKPRDGLGDYSVTFDGYALYQLPHDALAP